MNALPTPRPDAAALPRQRSHRAAAIVAVVGVVCLGGAGVGAVNALRHDGERTSAAEVLPFEQPAPTAPALPEAGEVPTPLTLAPAPADAPTITNIGGDATTDETIAPADTLAPAPTETLAPVPLDPTTTEPEVEEADDESDADSDDELLPMPADARQVVLANGLNFPVDASLDLTINDDNTSATISGDNAVLVISEVTGATSTAEVAAGLQADLAEDVIDFDLNDWGNSSAIEPGTVEKNVFSYEGVAGSGSLGSTPIFGIVLVYLRVDGLIFTIEVTMALDSNGDALTPDENAYNLTMQYLDVGV